MKHSLRSLMIVVTLVCVIVGGRVEYLRQSRPFHVKELMREADWIQREEWGRLNDPTPAEKKLIEQHKSKMHTHLNWLRTHKVQ